MKELKIKREELSSKSAVVKLQGHLDVSTHSVFEKTMTRYLQRYSNFLLDMEKLVGLSSAGAGSLLSISNQISQLQGALVIYNLPANIVNTLEVLGLCSKDEFAPYQLRVEPTREKAIEALAGKR